MKVCIAQLNGQVGAIEDRCQDIIDTIASISDDCEWLITAELSICGYPPQDLLLHDHFLEACQTGVEKIKAASKQKKNTHIVIGYPKKTATGKRNCQNVAGIIKNGKLCFETAKQLLPNYDIFDEDRTFDSGSEAQLFNTEVGILICEDLWFERTTCQYPIDPVESLVNKGAKTLIAIMASPYEIEKDQARHERFSKIAKKHRVNLIVVNQVGGHDGLIFDGQSTVYNQSGDCIYKAAACETVIETIDTETQTIIENPVKHPQEILKKALCMGINDYVKKSGFSSVILGLSGGIDSAIVAALATEALGSENVFAIRMPSQYSSKGSLDDAEALANNLNISCRTLPIQNTVNSLKSSLDAAIEGPLKSITEENLQARNRGLLLMALSNQEGHMLLSTGNKSELALGYCTLYGDMNGGLSVIGDLYKTQVYALAKYINKDKEIIPESSITKPPSAELKPDQCDQDSLPPYETIDPILSYYIEDKLSPKDIENKGYDKAEIAFIVNKLRQTEYKRHQAAPVLKVSPTAFGPGRRRTISAKLN